MIVAFLSGPASAQTGAQNNPEPVSGEACFSASLRGPFLKLDAGCSGLDDSDFQWNLGDGSTASGRSVSHRYRQPGDYRIVLNAAGGKARAEGTVTALRDPAWDAIEAKKLPPEAGHVANPYLGADKYVNPDYALSVRASLAKTRDGSLAARMRGLEGVPTAVWLDRIDAIHGGARNDGRASLEEHFLRALQQQKSGVPMVLELVVYNLPNRDCAALASNGTLDFQTGGLETYKSEYIDVIAALMADPRFASLRFAVILEPDSLPNMVINLWHPKCALVAKNEVYRQGVQHALQRFSQIGNAYVFMDIGHSGWLGWDGNLRATVQYFTQVVKGADTERGLAAVDGFVTNISNFTPTEEVSLGDPERSIQGAALKSAEFYGWNPLFDERAYAESLYREFVGAGFSKNIRFLIDTSRNGWGGRDRPHQPSSAANVNDYVDQSRLDRRSHRGNWCNPAGAGLGERPLTSPYGAEHPVGAFVWVKPPGESDGSSEGGPGGKDSEGRSLDPMCDPAYVGVHGPTPSGKPTGAMPHAPSAGRWFHDQFVMLVRNAHPPLEEVPPGKSPVHPPILKLISRTFTAAKPLAVPGLQAKPVQSPN